MYSSQPDMRSDGADWFHRSTVLLADPSNSLCTGLERERAREKHALRSVGKQREQKGACDDEGGEASQI